MLQGFETFGFLKPPTATCRTNTHTRSTGTPCTRSAEIAGREEKAKFSSCDNAKEIWDKLEVIHEGTNEMKETKISLLNLNYENFKMDPNEDIKAAFNRIYSRIDQPRQIEEAADSSRKKLCRCSFDKRPRNLPRRYPCDNGNKKVTAFPPRDIVYKQDNQLSGLRDKPITQQDALPRSEGLPRYLSGQDPLSLSRHPLCHPT
ncbi:hypothetical protein V6N11_017628 [Hibiscus sabdariffa]|uniref:Uncharacterized protein n=1 Tax=Hibiscus sabdariffa TaxID=183260 RepID=A0ABR2TZ79_9ROSI